MAIEGRNFEEMAFSVKFPKKWYLSLPIHTDYNGKIFKDLYESLSFNHRTLSTPISFWKASPGISTLPFLRKTIHKLRFKCKIRTRLEQNNYKFMLTWSDDDIWFDEEDIKLFIVHEEKPYWIMCRVDKEDEDSSIKTFLKVKWHCFTFFRM